MGSLMRAARAVVPAPLKQRLRQFHRDAVLRRTVRRIAAQSEGAELSPSLAERLAYGWGNEGMAAGTEFLRAMYAMALATRGPVLECGAGISTVVLGLAADRTGSTVVSLEHDAFWAERVRVVVRGLRIRSVRVCHAPLASYGEFEWYKPSPGCLPDAISLVVCDGPPGDTVGGRYGLLPCVSDRLTAGSVILLDDVERAAELETLQRWAGELSAVPEVSEGERPYGVLRVPPTGSRARGSGSVPPQRQQD